MKRKLLWASCIVMFVAYVLTIVIGAVVIFAQAPRVAGSGVPKDLDVRADQLEKRLEMYKDRADEIQSVLMLVFTVTAAFATILGVNTFVSVKEAKDSAERAVRDVTESTSKEITTLREISDKAVTELHRIRAETERQYPTFGGVDENIRKILGELETVFYDNPEKSDDYRNLNPTQRQSLFFWEMSLAGMDFLHLKQFAAQLSRVYRGYGNLYASKFWFEKEQGAGASIADLDRGSFYYDRALSHDPTNVQALNDKGFYHMDHSSPDLIRIAREAFQASLDRNRCQQKPLFNLALIALLSDRDYDAALRFINRASECGVWQPGESIDRGMDIRYHRAVIRARLAATIYDPDQNRRCSTLRWRIWKSFV